MRLAAFDIESHLIRKDGDITTMLAPRPVSLAYATDAEARLFDRAGGLAWLRASLADPELTLVGHNVTFDLGCYAAEDPALLPLIFAAYEGGRIRCTMMRQKLIDIAQGELKFRTTRGKLRPARHTLAALADHWKGEELAKAGTPRLHYGDLDGVPIVDWPLDAVDYALKDATTTLEVWHLQDAFIHRVTGPWLSRPLTPLADEAHQNRAAWALHLMSMWGVRTDAARVRALDDVLTAQHIKSMGNLITDGLMRADGTRDMKAIRARVEAWFRAHNLPVPMSDPSPKFPRGQVSVGSEDLEKTSDPGLLTLAAVASDEAIRTHWLPALRVGTTAPICCRYNTPMETGRTSSSAPNMQNPAKKGGVRECFIPRPGYVYAGADYDTLELRTLAQECEELTGRSAMADALRAGRDLHLEVAAVLLGCSPDEAARRYAAGDTDTIAKRDLAKIANFGFPGGMVPATFQGHCARFGVIITLEEAASLHRAWHDTWPEMAAYFRIIKGMVGYGGEGDIVQSMSLRLRGAVRFTAAANSRFQGRAADGAKEALWRLAVEAYTGLRTDGAPGVSPLYGSRPVVFMHDEVVAECPEATAHEAAVRLGEVMCEAMSKWVPSVPIKAGPILMRRWWKGCKAVHAAGRLVPAKPVEGKDATGKKKVTWELDPAPLGDA